ncbi:hypothetical protein [uncultured Oscillibacter sp.]|uniref:hypothetical protein n=1 Tax=uncultured Oscillibacter sp. TaxID=876091 RepID=UPI002636A4C1|nr:hypothetical protein [uncultured Oscillibacter sp.]
MNIHVQLKRIYTALNETYDLTRQLAEAVDRNDQVTVQMLVAMRQEPVEKLRRGQQVLDQLKAALPQEAQGPMEALLKGSGTPAPEEAALANQAAINQRLLKQLVDLDRIVNRKVTREKSIYQ